VLGNTKHKISINPFIDQLFVPGNGYPIATKVVLVLVVSTKAFFHLIKLDI